MAQSRAVLESAPGVCLTIEAGASLGALASVADSAICTDTGEDVVVGAPADLSISSIGLMLERRLGSFDISSGLESREDRISPPPELLSVVVGGACGGEIFCRIEASISSCTDSLAMFSFPVMIYPRLPFLKPLISSAARERSPSVAIDSAWRIALSSAGPRFSELGDIPAELAS